MKAKRLIVLLIGILVACQNKKESEISQYRIAVVSIVEIDPIKQLREGFYEIFESSAFAKTKELIIDEYNAQNDPSIINQIVDGLAVDKPDMIYVLGTPIAQVIQKRIPDVLLVQGTATDPVAAGLADSWSGSGRNYIATTDLPPINLQIKLIKKLTPNVKRIGIIYNPGEVNSVAVVSRLREYIKINENSIKLVERPISNTSEVATVTQSLLGNVDAIYLPPDNTAHAAIPVIGRFANDNKLPFYATVQSAIDEGAIATLSLDFYVLGKETAKLALRVLQGEKASQIPITPMKYPQITINGKLVREYKLDIAEYSNKNNVKIIE
ncbi:ABC transporter substrate-binding protein [bacterium]|nr:ABC transporter substrate-binding protein [bacterium]